MRYFTRLLIVFIVLSGCINLDKTIERKNSVDESKDVSLKVTRQPAIISNKTLGIYNKDSLFEYPIFRGMQESENDKDVSPFQSEIYRTIYPWNGESDIFNNLFLRLEKKIDMSLGDILVPYLLSEESTSLSDKELYEKISPVTEVYVFSKYTDTYKYRMIALNENSSNSEWACWHYFIQVWDEHNIWAQPLCEGVEFEFKQAVFVPDLDGNQMLLLSGRANRPGGSSFATAGTGFIYEDGIWNLIKWNEIYEGVSVPENLEIKSDAIIMLYIDPYMAKAFNLPLHKGPLYELSISEDGAFWADFSSFPINNNVSKKLLFVLKGENKQN